MTKVHRAPQSNTVTQPYSKDKIEGVALSLRPVALKSLIKLTEKGLWEMKQRKKLDLRGTCRKHLSVDTNETN